MDGFSDYHGEVMATWQDLEINAAPAPPYPRKLPAHRLSRRRLLAGGAAISSAAVLAACGEDRVVEVERVVTVEVERVVTVEKVVTVEVSPTAAPEPDLVETSDASPAFHNVEISFQFNGLSQAGRESARAEIARFKDLTGIAVMHDFSTWDRGLQKIVNAMAAQSAPDIWLGGSTWIPPMASMGQALEIDESVASWDEWSDFYPTARDGVTYNEHIYGVPIRAFHRGSPVIRASMFEAAGLEPRPPTTWGELNEIAARLTIRDGQNLIQAGINLEHDTQVYEDWLLQAGGAAFNADRTRPTNNTPEGIAALAQHVRHGLLDFTTYPGGIGSSDPDLHAFCDGAIAYQQLWPGNLGNCEISAPDVFADVVVGEPLQGPNEQAMNIYFDTYMSWTLTKHPDATFETMKYFASPGPNYIINAIGDRNVLPCRAAMESYGIYQREPYRSFAQNVKFGVGRQIVPEHFDIQPAMSRWVESAAYGDLSVEEALIEMDAEVADIIGAGR